MEFKSYKELLEEYAKDIQVSNIGDTVLKHAFYAGYKARLRQELALKGLPGNDIYPFNNWTLLNYGAHYSTDMNFGENACGYYLTYDEANNVPLFRLPTKKEFESLTRNYMSVAMSNSSYAGYFYNHRIGFKTDQNYPYFAIFYHRTHHYAIDGSRFYEKYKDFPADYVSACVWLADEVSEEKALAVALPMIFENGAATGRMLEPIYIEVEKKEKLQVHYIFDISKIEKELGLLEEVI